jgi:hypothetical protein
MKRAVSVKMRRVSAIAVVVSFLGLCLPSTTLGAEYGLSIDVSPNIINIASERWGDIRILTRMRYSDYVADGSGAFVYFNDSESVSNITATRDSLGNLILKFSLNDLLVEEDHLLADAYNDVSVVVTMENGDEYIGEDQVYLVDKNAPR